METLKPHIQALIAATRPIVEACEFTAQTGCPEECPLVQLYRTFFNLPVAALEEGSGVACELFYDPENEW